MQRVYEICFAAVVMVFGGVSLLTNQRLYRFLDKPRFELGVFPADQSRLSVCGALPETAECLDDFETIGPTKLAAYNPTFAQLQLAFLETTIIF